MKRISQNKENDVRQLLQSGLSLRAVATQAHVSLATVQRVQRDGCIDRNRLHAGRPCMLTTRMKKTMTRYIVRDKLGTAVQVKRAVLRDFGMFVSADTVRRGLREGGLRAIEKKKKPALTEKQQKARYEWALRHQHWTMDDWRRVIWSDEVRIALYGSDGRSWAWKAPDAPLQREHVRQTKKFGGGSIMVWSCISWQGIGFMSLIEGTMNGELYLEVMKDELWQSIDEAGLNPREVIYMHDNASPHTTKTNVEWLDKQPFKTMVWPANSPDLNPIENMWSRLKYKLFHEYDDPPKGINMLWDRTVETWYNIERDEVRKYMETMPKRVQHVLKSKGMWIKY